MNLKQYLPPRDSKVWTVGVLLGMIAAAVTNLGLKTCDVHMEHAECVVDATRFAYYAIPDGLVPVLRLITILGPIFSARNMTSNQPHSEYGAAKFTPEDTQKE